MNTKIIKDENKIPDTSSLVTTAVLNTKIGEVENKIPDHRKYITTQEFNKLTEENISARLRKANLVRKTDFDNKLISFHKRITSNKTKYLEVQKKLNSLQQVIKTFFYAERTLKIMMDLKTRLFIKQHLTR